MALFAIGGAMNEVIKRGKTEHPMICVCCGCAFNAGQVPKAFGVLLPMFPQEGQYVGAHGICERCADRADLQEQILKTLQEQFPSWQFSKASGTRQ